MSLVPSPDALDARALAGQLVCVALRDHAGGPDERERFVAEIADRGWGGVIVFGGRLAAVMDLLAEARDRAPIPPLAAGDFERGLGQQFPADGTTYPSIMALAAADDPALARRVGVVMGRELRAHGFEVNFAPVADVAIEPANPILAPPRAAADDPARVAAVVEAFVEGSQEAGVAATLKHFPGHGRTTLDTHDALPVVEAERDDLEAVDLLPFRTGIDAGARLAMTAHVAYPALEPDAARDRPATLSPAILTGLLREAWGFDGVVSSDALMMGALAGTAPDEVARRAIEAGVDWLLYPSDPVALHDRLTAAIETGRLDRGRCERAAGRVLALKRWVVSRAPADPGPPAAGAPLAEAVAGAALTADPADPPAAPAWPDRAQWVVVLDGAIAPEAIVVGREVAPPAAERVVVVDTTAPEPEARERIAEARERSAGAVVACLVASPIRAWKGRPGLSQLGREAVEAALGPARESALIVLSNPRIVGQVRAPSRTIWTYGEDAASQRAAVAFLRGALPARGRSPLAGP